MADLRKNYTRAGIVEIAIVHELASNSGGEPVEIQGHRVRVNSLRLQTFRETGLTCPTCKLEASYYAIERTARGNEHSYHLNLWGVTKDGRHILFTHDHVLARCLGGKDELSNTTTMCQPCNNKKGAQEQLLKVSRENGMSPNEWLSKRRAAQGLPTRGEVKTTRRAEIIERLLTDEEYRNTVRAHQVRLGKNQYPEVFGKL